MAKSSVYCIENLRTGARYIGSARDVAVRWREHVADLNQRLHSNKGLQEAWVKYGEDAFRCTVIEEVSGGEAGLRRCEQHWIEEYGRTTTLYNVPVVESAKKADIVTISFKLDRATDREVLGWLDRQENRSEAIRDVIRKHLQDDISLVDVFQAIKLLEKRLEAGVVSCSASGSGDGEWHEDPAAAAALDALAKL